MPPTGDAPSPRGASARPVDLAELEPIIDQALELPESERGAFLDRACAGRAGLRASVDRILALGVGGGPLDQSVGALGLTLADAADEPQPGRRYGAYRIVREIGHGGMGTVYLAERADAAFDMSVALKVIRHERHTDPDVIRHFRDEQQILAKLQHPNIARLIDGGIGDDGVPYLAMEHMAGATIADYCRAERIPIPQRLRLFLEVCAAVEHAHRNLVVHRDLKPSNIMVTPEGTVKLLDFGVAKLLSTEAAPGASRWRALTPEYAAPEQVVGSDVSTAADIYSLGVVLCELLTGARPIAGTREEMITWLRTATAPPPLASSLAAQDGERPLAPPISQRQLVRRLRGDLDAIVARAIARDPRERYPTVEQLADDVRRVLDGRVVLARHPTTWAYVRKWVARHRLTSVAAGLAMAALLALGVNLRIQSERLRVAALEAARERDRALASGRMLTSLFSEIGDLAGNTGVVPMRTLLELGGQRLNNDSILAPVLQSQMAGFVGRGLWLNGQRAVALPYLERAVADVPRRTREDSVRLMYDLWPLAQALLYRQRPIEAESVLTRALAIGRSVGEARDVAVTLGELGQVHRDLGQFGLAEQRAREAVVILARPPVDFPVLLSHTLARLGHLAVARGDGRLADSSYREAMRYAVLGWGRAHPEYGEAMVNLAVARSLLGDRDGADSLMRAGVHLQEQVLGASHDNVLDNKRQLAWIMAARGRLPEADSLLRVVTTGFRTAHPADSVARSRALTDLLVISARRGRCDAVRRVAVELNALRTDPPSRSGPPAVDSALRRCTPVSSR